MYWYLREEIQIAGPNSPQWCPESGEEAKGTNQNTVNQHPPWLLPLPKAISHVAARSWHWHWRKHLHFSPGHFPGLRDRDEKAPIHLAQTSRAQGWIHQQSFSNGTERGRMSENAFSCWQQPNKGSLQRHAELVTGMQGVSLGLRGLSYSSRVEKWSWNL